MKYPDINIQMKYSNKLINADTPLVSLTIDCFHRRSRQSEAHDRDDHADAQGSKSRVDERFGKQTFVEDRPHPAPNESLQRVDDDDREKHVAKEFYSRLALSWTKMRQR